MTSYLSQVRQMRKLAQMAVKRFAVKKPKLYFINHAENTTFRVEAGGKKYLLRIHRDGYHSKAAMGEELAWLHRVENTTNLAVPKPILSKNGIYLEQVPFNGIDRYCDLLHWVDGKFIFKKAMPRHFEKLGELIALLQKSARPLRVKHRRYWDSQGLVGMKPKFGPIHSLLGATKKEQAIINENRELVFSKLRRFEQKFPERQGLIHADLHFGNFLVRKDGLGAIDFDDCGFGFYAYDLAIPLVHIYNPEKPERFKPYVEAIKAGYLKKAKWDKHDDEILPYLFTARRLLMLGWLQSRSDNPKLKKILEKSIKRTVKYLRSDWEQMY